MSYQQLLAWIQVAQLETSSSSDVLEFVEAALDEIPEDDARHDALLDIEDRLLEGEVPVELLQSLLSDVAGEMPVDDVERIEREYRAIATAYLPEQWRSNFYLDLEFHLAESEDEELVDYVDSLRERLTNIWEKYSADYESITTTSAETVVGHRLMKDGYETWMRALDLVDDDDAEDEEILETAEAAVRLLIAVGQLDRDVRMQAGSLGGNSSCAKA